jgi:uncharacterized protein (DUF2249 family)
MQAIPQSHYFDARGVAKRFRHAAIFGALEALGDGETMRFINDHDPQPLLDQIIQRYQGQVRINYQQRNAEAVIIDFTIDVDARGTPVELPQAAMAGGGCGSAGSGCGCSGEAGKG